MPPLAKVTSVAEGFAIQNVTLPPSGTSLSKREEHLGAGSSLL
jgi:hypothetical protein